MISANFVSFHERIAFNKIYLTSFVSQTNIVKQNGDQANNPAMFIVP